MNRMTYILVLIAILISEVIGFTQDTNPFEIKSRSNDQTHQQIKKNVFEIEDKVIDTFKQEKAINGALNPFEINNGHINKKRIKSSKTKTTLTEVKQKTFTGTSDFLLWLFLFILVFIAILLSINRNLILKIIKVIWYYNHTNSLLRNFNTREFLFYFFLYIVFLVNLSVLVYEYIKIGHGHSGLNFFLKIWGIVSIIYILKHIFIILFNGIFPSLKGLVLYNFTTFLFNISLGIFLIPINLIVVYSIPSISSFFLVFGLIIIGAMYLIRLFRGFLVTYNYFSISIFHFFIYLCAFEILPLLFLYRFFINFL